MTRCVRAVIAVALISSVTQAQLLRILTSPNSESDGQFGYSIAALGDINGDGCDDLIVGAPYEETYDWGRAYVFSGQNGSLIRFYYGSYDDWLGTAVSGISDINGDGYNDILIGAPGRFVDEPGNGVVYLASGFGGDFLWWIPCPPHPTPDMGSELFGNAVAEIGDVTGDGISDLVAGAYGIVTFADESFAGHAYIINGSDGASLHLLWSQHWQGYGYFGCSVAGIGDIDGDGVPDVVVGAEGENAGYAYTFSGNTGSLICELQSLYPETDGRFGSSVAGIGDIDGDGIPDVAVGAPDEDAVLANAGRVYLINGSDGTVIRALQSPSDPAGNGHFGAAVAGIDDVTADGIQDILVGAPGESHDGYQGAGRVYVFDGQSGSFLYAFTSPESEIGGAFGCTVTRGGDLNGDGFMDLLIGACNEDVDGVQNAGRVYAFSNEVVPVKLSLFEAEVVDHGTLIRWRTESEENCYGFFLYRRITGSIGRSRITEEPISAHGTTSIQHEYEYLDEVTQEGTYRYWLEEVAKDGRRTEYGPIEVVIHSLILSMDGPNPNPVSAETDIVLSIPGRIQGQVTLQLFDHAGRRIGRPIQINPNSDGLVHWNATDTNTPSGLYWWRLQTDDQQITRPMIVLRR